MGITNYLARGDQVPDMDAVLIDGVQKSLRRGVSLFLLLLLQFFYLSGFFRAAKPFDFLFGIE